jgi:hypothetical protein
VCRTLFRPPVRALSSLPYSGNQGPPAGLARKCASTCPYYRDCKLARVVNYQHKSRTLNLLDVSLVSSRELKNCISTVAATFVRA